tara:strand:+ start:6385 stop:7401 length:1017 start_codon:yes stop_codon:yes gene_type:complete
MPMFNNQPEPTPFNNFNAPPEAGIGMMTPPSVIEDIPVEQPSSNFAASGSSNQPQNDAGVFSHLFGGNSGFGNRENGQANSANQRAADEQIKALKEAGFIAETGLEEAQHIFDPYSNVAKAGIRGADILTDPQAQMDFLQNNPIFQQSLANANQATQASAAASGRLATGDTMEQLSSNTLLAAQPLLSQQQANVQNLLGMGTGIAGSQAQLGQEKALTLADIMSQQGEAAASGIIGFQNRQDDKRKASKDRTASTLGSIAQIGAMMFMSDERLKTNIKKIGKINEFNKYSWTWNEKANEIGLFGESRGVIAQEVQAVNEDYVMLDKTGYLKVNYEEIV